MSDPLPHRTDEALSHELQQLRQECIQLREDNAQLRKLLGLLREGKGALAEATSDSPTGASPLCPAVVEQSPLEQKIGLFRTLFRGRDDVYPIWWMNQRTGANGYAPAVKGGWTRRTSGVPLAPTDYLPLTDDVLRDHLSGRQTVGIYPLLPDATCWFLACDFDGKHGASSSSTTHYQPRRSVASSVNQPTPTWALDARAFLDACDRHGIPAYLERSCSGQGGHVWIFFASPVPAHLARRLGFSLLRETMAFRGELDLESYDRFFPSQDTLPKGGFGNLIALPLQQQFRLQGNTEFIDQTFRPWPDQWTFLSQIQRLSATDLEPLIAALMPVNVGPGSVAVITAPALDDKGLPPTITCGLGERLVVHKAGLPAWLISELRHLASLHNPVFYERQKLRLSTYRTPRFIRCYEEDPSSLFLPRGILEDVRSVVVAGGSSLAVRDLRPQFKQRSFQFHGTLAAQQKAAVRSLLHHDFGVLVAPPGAGKTVMACAIMAERGVPTLILVHRKPLLEQWRVQLSSLLDLPLTDIGEISSVKRRPTRMVDLGMVQSLRQTDDRDPFHHEYGLLIVDECHHVPAFSFESILKRACVKYVLGLTATPYRRDGLQDLIIMQCGPVRHRMSTRPTLEGGDLVLEVKVRETAFSLTQDASDSIQDVFGALVRDEARLQRVTEDILLAVQQGRRCLILSERKEHCRLLNDRLVAQGLTPLIVDGGIKKQAREAVLDKVCSLPRDQDLVLIATGQYLGEGFDCPQVDTLFLTFPVSFKGKLIQYLGRIMRTYPGKTSVCVYDYADVNTPVLRHMYLRRLKTYGLLGIHGAEAPTAQPTLSLS